MASFQWRLLQRWLGRSRSLYRKLQGLQGQGRSAPAAGFTLVELLVTVIISSVIVITLLSLVVELVSTNRRELARSETQRDMGIAAEYISNELREAVYVYTGECLSGGIQGSAAPCPGLFDGAGGLTAPNNSIPLIAFWKLEPVPSPCTAAECEDYRISGRTYTLVVYFLSTDNPNGIWQGQARITRGEIPRFQANGTASTPYQDPTAEGSSFRNWSSPTAVNFGGREFSPEVLVDFADATPDDRETATCPAGYKITPDGGALTGDFANLRSIYACVRDDAAGAVAGQEQQVFNQKVVLFVRGNPEGRYGLDRAFCEKESLKATLRDEDNACKLPVVKTEVQNRGVANKRGSSL
ncbi:MAG: prepilin-type N-terminal cleavage/methylation domain-containing protein [Cyanobacteria bacterium]|nr:prepilin-type N-terminal cleavage/methylation domain-containing protein [Cyanobacteriota bacterium]